MGFLDSLSKTLSSGVDRAKFEADKFQRTSRISGEISNVKSQIDTNVRQLGERALELYQQGTLTAPEIASLAQIIGQLREQLTEKETELNTAQAESFEAWQVTQAQMQPSSSQNVPISTDPGVSYVPDSPSSSDTSSGAGSSSYTSFGDTGASTPTYTGRSYSMPESTDVSGSGMPNSSSVGGGSALPATQVCSNCGYTLPGSAMFCPNCGTRTRTA